MNGWIGNCSLLVDKDKMHFLSVELVNLTVSQGYPDTSLDTVKSLSAVNGGMHESATLGNSNAFKQAHKLFTLPAYD